jgi:hypothetical protein
MERLLKVGQDVDSDIERLVGEAEESSMAHGEVLVAGLELQIRVLNCLGIGYLNSHIALLSHAHTIKDPIFCSVVRKRDGVREQFPIPPP